MTSKNKTSQLQAWRQPDEALLHAGRKRLLIVAFDVAALDGWTSFMILPTAGRRNQTGNSRNMPVLMFWNVHNGSAIPYLADACFENSVDVLILAEDNTPSGYTASALNSVSSRLEYREYEPVPSDLKFFYRPSAGNLYPSADVSNRCSIRFFQGADGHDLLIIAVHMQSKLRAKETDQYLIARSMRAAIEDAEVRANHQNSLVIGDFNMNPFEAGMVALDLMNPLILFTIFYRRYRVMIR